MKLYFDPIAITCRPILLFLAEHDLPVALEQLSLFDGDAQSEAYAALNPNRAVPLLVDGEHRLTQSSAILKFLATEAGSALYPADAWARAQVNAAMDWLTADFYPLFGPGFVYPQVIPQYARPTPEAQESALAWGLARSRERLAILDRDLLGTGRAHLCGADMTIADYLGASMVTAGEWVGFDYEPYPNIRRWLDGVRARPSWPEVNAAFAGMSAALRAQREPLAA